MAAAHLVGGFAQHGITAAIGGVELQFGGVVLFEPGGHQAPAHVHEDPLRGVSILSNEQRNTSGQSNVTETSSHPHSLREVLWEVLWNWLCPLKEGIWPTSLPRDKLELTALPSQTMQK